MTSEKTIRAVIAVLLLTFADVALTYGLQYVILAIGSDRSQIGIDILLIFLAGVPAVLVQIIFALMSKKLTWFETKETCLIILINMVLYALLMLIVFDRIPIAFSMIPTAEMAYGFLQLLIKIFACVAAGICAIVSLIIMAANRSNNIGR